ncbi:MAG: cutinase family protein [Polyangiales bacterium]
MVRSLVRGLAVGAVMMTTAVATNAATSSTAEAQIGGCSDVHVVFARGSGELPGLGIVGGPLVNSIKSKLRGQNVTSYAVNYLADVAQTSAGAGATDTTNHITAKAAQCPETKFVVGGYSQGASVMDIALGVPNFLGLGKALPENLRDRVVAVVLFGNPLALTGGKVEKNATWGARTKEFCNLGDPVCAAGVNVMAHITYGLDGSTDRAADFVVTKVGAQ